MNLDKSLQLKLFLMENLGVDNDTKLTNKTT